MKRILVFGASARLGGTESYLLTLYKNIDKRQIQFDFLFPHETGTIPYEQEIIRNGGCVYREYYTNKERNIKGYMSTKDIIERHPEINGVYVNVQCIHTAYGLLVEAYKHRLKYRILHIHSSDYVRKPTLKESLYEKYFYLTFRKIVTHCLACSKMAGKWIYHKQDFEIIPNSIDLEKFRYNNLIRNTIRKKYHIEEKHVIGFCGRLCHTKNPDFLLEIFQELYSLDSDAYMFIVGNGEKKEQLEETVKKYNLRKCINFVGEIDNVQDYLQAMDFFVLPSRHEGFGIVLLEAQTAGLNCITSAGAVPKETNVTGRVHFISLDKTARAWAQKILSIGFERKDCFEIMKASEYSIDNLIKKMETIFELDNINTM